MTFWNSDALFCLKRRSFRRLTRVKSQSYDINEKLTVSRFLHYNNLVVWLWPAAIWDRVGVPTSELHQWFSPTAVHKGYPSKHIYYTKLKTKLLSSFKINPFLVARFKLQGKKQWFRLQCVYAVRQSYSSWQLVNVKRLITFILIL